MQRSLRLRLAGLARWAGCAAIAVLLWGMSCSKPPDYAIVLCTDFVQKKITCPSAKHRFAPSDSVYVIFECNLPPCPKKVRGSFYSVDEQGRKRLGTRDWTLEPGEDKAYDFLIMARTGNYAIEFYNESGQLLVETELSVH